MLYKEITKEVEEKLNNQKGLFCAFSNKQFEEGMEKIGLDIKEVGKLTDIGAGGFILTTEAENFLNIFKVKKEKMQEMFKNEEETKNAMRYELNNHEYSYTYDEEDALSALGLTIEEVEGSEMLSRALKQAKFECLRDSD